RFAVFAGLILAVTVATPALGVRRPRKHCKRLCGPYVQACVAANCSAITGKKQRRACKASCKRSTLKSCQLDRSTFTACVSPVSFTIQELPPLSDYGTQLGQISHAFLIYEQLLLARRLDELQVAQLGLNGSVDLGAAVSTLYYHLMPSANFARQDVDTVIAN